MILKASPEEIRTAGKKLVSNAESYLASVKSLYETVDGLKELITNNSQQLYMVIKKILMH